MTTVEAPNVAAQVTEWIGRQRSFGGDPGHWRQVVDVDAGCRVARAAAARTPFTAVLELDDGSVLVADLAGCRSVVRWAAEHGRGWREVFSVGSGARVVSPEAFVTEGGQVMPWTTSTAVGHVPSPPRRLSVRNNQTLGGPIHFNFSGGVQ